MAGGSGDQAAALETVVCPPTMAMPATESATSDFPASGGVSSDLKWASGGLPHCQLDVSMQ